MIEPVQLKLEESFLRLSDGEASTIAVRAALRSLPMLTNTQRTRFNLNEAWQDGLTANRVLDLFLSLQSAYQLTYLTSHDLTRREYSDITYRRAMRVRANRSHPNNPSVPNVASVLSSIAYATESTVYSSQALAAETSADADDFHRRSCSSAARACDYANAMLSTHPEQAANLQLDIAAASLPKVPRLDREQRRWKLLEYNLNEEQSIETSIAINYFKEQLLSLNGKFQVWIDWYQDRLDGKPFDNAWEHACIALTEEQLRQTPTEINAYLASLKRSDRGLIETVEPADLVPAQQPAAIRPIIAANGKLTLPDTLVTSDMPDNTLKGLIAALRAELTELAESANETGNIDRRFCDELQKTAELLSDDTPGVDVVFRLAHRSDFFAAYAPTALEEWPDVHAQKLVALNLMLERLLQKIPEWQAFIAVPASDVALELDGAQDLAVDFGAALGDGEMAPGIDSALPEAFEELGSSGPQQPVFNAEFSTATAKLTRDILESVNNTLKPLAEKALKPAADALSKVARKFFERLAKSAEEEAGKQGDVWGKRLIKWTARASAATGAYALGFFDALQSVSPSMFGWLTNVLRALGL